jgi:hypothetical protein
MCIFFHAKNTFPHHEESPQKDHGTREENKEGWHETPMQVAHTQLKWEIYEYNNERTSQ